MNPQEKGSSRSSRGKFLKKTISQEERFSRASRGKILKRKNLLK
jgi:hypothetical protein